MGMFAKVNNCMCSLLELSKFNDMQSSLKLRSSLSLFSLSENQAEMTLDKEPISKGSVISWLSLRGCLREKLGKFLYTVLRSLSRIARQTCSVTHCLSVAPFAFVDTAGLQRWLKCFISGFYFLAGETVRNLC